MDQAGGGRWSPRHTFLRAGLLPALLQSQRPASTSSLADPDFRPAPLPRVLGTGEEWTGRKGRESLLASFYLNQRLARPVQGVQYTGFLPVWRLSLLRLLQARVSAPSAQPVLGGAQGLLEKSQGTELG